MNEEENDRKKIVYSQSGQVEYYSIDTFDICNEEPYLKGVCENATHIEIRMSNIVTLDGIEKVKDTVLEIEMDDCSKLSTILHIGVCCHLKSISLSNIGNDFTSLHGLGNCKSLEKLSIYHCEKLADVGDISGCVKLSNL